jgi:hypothetical protein
MTFPLSIVFVSLGAVLVWGMTANVAGLDLEIVGWIGIVIGLVGVALSLFATARGRYECRARRGYGVRS